MTMQIFLGEFLGTLALIVLGCGVVANVLLTQSKGQNSGWMVIATGWFVAVVIGVFVAQSAGSINADINPAVSLAKFILRMYSFDRMIMMMTAQILGAFFGAIIVWLAYLPHWQVTENAKLKLLVFSTEPAIRHYPSNLLCEIIATMVLVLGVGAIFGKATYSHPVMGLGPYL